MEIALDFDDLICDFSQGLRDSVYREFGVAVDPFTEWALGPILDPILGQSWWEWLEERPDRWVNFPPLPGAIGGIAQLRRDGHYLECVTAKPEWAEFIIWEWFGIHHPAVQRVTIVDLNTAKTDATDADLLVDDRPEYVQQFVDDGRQAILFDRSHNMAVPTPEGAFRAKGWKSVIELIRMEEAVRA